MIVDHIYFCTDKPKELTDFLKNKGFVEGEPNSHPGQGTANHRFFFNNFMLEILYITDEAELSTERTKVLGIKEQFKSKNICKFGVIMRPNEEKENSFNLECEKYEPTYLPDGLHMNIISKTSEDEPKFIYLDFAGPLKGREECKQYIGDKEIKKVTKIRYMKNGVLSKTLKEICAISNISVLNCEDNFLELEFDNGINGKTDQLEPIIPLRIKW
jgi:hypothetical protein